MPPAPTTDNRAYFFDTRGKFRNRCREKRRPGALSCSYLRYLLCQIIDVLRLDDRPSTPRLPQRRWGALAQLGSSAALHVTVLLLTIVGAMRSSVGIDAYPPAPIVQDSRDVRHIVFLAPELPRVGGGGGGGGNRQAGPIRRAQGVGTEAVTLRTQRSPTPAPVPIAASPALLERVSAPPAIMLDARPLASGTRDESGLAISEGSEGTSAGPGSGGGVGTGIGTGIGPGRGPGLGPGSGGGTGGGVYRPGGAVTAPRVITEVQPTYSPDALQRRIQGSVLLEAVVTREGRASQIRVLRSLDATGLDQQAIAAVAQWRFEPGRLAGTPVDVVVTIIIDFVLR